MKSIDMFSSADSRKKNEKIFLEERHVPEGDAVSPHVISLWSNKNLPEKETEKKHEKDLKTIEDLFRGAGRIPDKSILKYETQHEKDVEKIESLFKGTGKIPHEEYSTLENSEYSAPSSNEQFDNIKNAKMDYPDSFSPRKKKQGFFRNFAFWD